MTHFTNAAAENKAKKAANKALAALPSYHPWIPIADIDAILEANGFQAQEPAIWCGREGRTVTAVSARTFLSLSWYRMDVTGRYEIVAYLS